MEDHAQGDGAGAGGLADLRRGDDVADGVGEVGVYVCGGGGGEDHGTVGEDKGEEGEGGEDVVQ